MEKFTYSYPTKVYFGKGAAADALKQELPEVGKTVMLAYGGGSVKKNGIYDEIKELLADAGKEVVEISGIKSNPTYDKAQEGATLVKEKGVDFILAVGGRQRSGLLQGHIGPGRTGRGHLGHGVQVEEIPDGRYIDGCRGDGFGNRRRDEFRRGDNL